MVVASELAESLSAVSASSQEAFVATKDDKPGCFWARGKRGSSRPNFGKVVWTSGLGPAGGEILVR